MYAFLKMTVLRINRANSCWSDKAKIPPPFAGLKVAGALELRRMFNCSSYRVYVRTKMNPEIRMGVLVN